MHGGPLEQAWADWSGAIDCGATGLLWSADQLREEAHRAAQILEGAGVDTGQRVALMLSNTAAFPVWLIGCLEVGANPVLLSLGTTESELDAVAKEAAISWVLHDPEDLSSNLSGWVERGEPVGLVGGDAARLFELSPSRVAQEVEVGAVLHATSGTYGRARLCVRNQRSALAEAENFLAGIGAYERCRIRVTTPLSHAFAFGFGWVCAMVSQSTLVLERNFNPRRLLARERDQASDIVALVPAMIKLLSGMGKGGGSVLGSLAFYAGAPCGVALRDEFEATFGTRLFAIYGSTETGGISSNYMPGAGGGDGVGAALPGVSVSIRDKARYESLGDGVGEVWVRSSALMQMYLGAEHATDGGFFNTRDLGVLDVAGQLRLVGRVKDMINLGGMKVDPAQVEEALLCVPGVLDVAVYPGVDRGGNEFVQAALELARGQSIDVETLRSHCAARLEPFKRPRLFHQVKALPRSASGKCLKFHCPGWGSVS